MILSPKRRPADGIHIGDDFLPWPTVAQGIALLGQPNSGKSHLMLDLMRQMPGRAAVVATTTKLGDYADYLEAYRSRGQARRCLRLGLDSAWKIDIGEFFTRTLPGGSARVLAHILTAAGEILAKSAGRESSSFWAGIISDTLYFSIQLAILSTGSARLDVVLRIINALPASTAEFGSDDFFQDNFCGQKLLEAKANRAPANDLLNDRVIEFVERIAGVGEKARGAAVQGAGSTIGALLVEFGDQVTGGSNLDLALVDKHLLGVIVDGCPLKYHDGGRVFNFLNVAAFQYWALARDPGLVDTVTAIFRDEIGFVLSAGHDAPIQAVARGVKLASIAAGQNIPVISGGMGGTERARLDAEAFLSLHNTKCFFANAEPSTTEFCSKVIGDFREEFVSVNAGGGHQESHDLMDLALGVRPACFSTSSHYERLVRPHQFSRLQTGQCYVHRDGRHRFLDLWEGRRASSR